MYLYIYSDDIKTFRCRLGGTFHMRPCVLNQYPQNMTKFSHLKKVVVGYDEPDSTYILQMFNDLARSNSSLIMMGDSVLQQLLYGVSCEAEREHMLPYNIGIRRHYEHMPVSIVKRNITMKINIPILFETVNRYNNENHAKSSKFLELHKDTIENHMVVLNAGLWYNTVNDEMQDPDIGMNATLDRYGYSYQQWYIDEMISFLKSFDEFAIQYPKKTFSIVYISTTAQHYNSSNGYFHKNYSYIDNNHTTAGGKCFAYNSLKNSQNPAADWRNALMYAHVLPSDTMKTLRSRNNTQFSIIDMHTLTKPLHDIHPIQGGTGDCTHYCYTPMLYQPIYHELSMISSRLPDSTYRE